MWDLIIILTTFTSTATAIVGYDCGGTQMNITTISLLSLGECDLPKVKPKAESTSIQLLQLSEFGTTEVRQCKIEIDRTVYHCGMHSHVSIVKGGQQEYLKEVTSDSCRRLHETGSMIFGYNVMIVDIKGNSSNSRSLTLAGTLTADGACRGSTYSDPYGTWDDVVVQARVRITLRNYWAPISLEENKVILNTGVRCAVSDSQCHDADGSNSFWSPTPKDNCQFDKYDVLFEGPATKLTNERGPTMYTVTSRDTAFALTYVSEFRICGYKMLRTEHPKLFIVETNNGGGFKRKTNIAINNLDIFSYVNSKFIYVEKHIKTQMTDLYLDVMKQKCQLERQVLMNALSLASLAPDEVAYTIMKEPGYLAVTAGEVLHIVKCVPVECSLRKVTTCYWDLPVTHRNQSLFLTAKSHILARKSAERECSDFLPVMYSLHGTWYKMTPSPVGALPPTLISPLTKIGWKYVNPANLATSGLYDMGDLQKLKDHILFPVEQPAILDALARGAAGQPVSAGQLDIVNLLDENTIEALAESTSKKIWSWFTTFGSFSAGVIGLYMFTRVLKLIVDTVIHGYTLHTVYGWSLHLIGALWSSVTHLLVHLARRPRDDQVAPSASQQEASHPTVPPMSPETTNPSNIAMKYSELRSRLGNV